MLSKKRPMATHGKRFEESWATTSGSHPTVLILAAWYVYHYRMTGYLLGNPEYFRYNVQSTLNPLRAVVALGLRLWQTFGYLHLWILSAAMALAMYRPALKNAHEQRKRIAIPTQLIFLAVTLVYVVFMSIVGGAALARYMLPVVPLVILTAVSTLWRRVQRWVAISCHRHRQFCGFPLLASALRILPRRQSCVPRLHRHAPACRSIPRKAIPFLLRADSVASIG